MSYLSNPVSLFLFVLLFLLAGCEGDKQTSNKPHHDKLRIALIHEGDKHHSNTYISSAAETYQANVKIDEFTATSDFKFDDHKDLKHYDLVLIDAATPGLPFSAEDFSALRDTTHLLVINPDDQVHGNVSLTEHSDIPLYWANPSITNYVNLVGYLLHNILGKKLDPPLAKPEIYSAYSLYHPAAKKLFSSQKDFIGWYTKRTSGHHYDAEKLTVGILTHRSYYQKQNTAYIDAIIKSIEARGGNAFTLLYKGNADFNLLLNNGQPIIDALLFSGERLNYQNLDKSIALAKSLNVPIHSALLYYQGTAQDYIDKPGGLAPELTPRVVSSEREGIFEPIVVGAKQADNSELNIAMSKQIEWRIERTLAWARLHRLSNADKRVVLTFWSEAGGKADVGGDPDDFLDVPGTLATLLPAMKARGYNVGDQPLPNAKALADLMAREASNVGGWAQGELARRIATDHTALIPEQQYLEWFHSLPQTLQSSIENTWGPAPGQVMVHEDVSGQRTIVIPKIEFGNVLIAPHPMWGYLENEQVLLSKDALPPHHQYLAFFLWLQKQWQADAWVSLFSNIVLQPGKSEGPLADDPIAILLGGLPHIHPERLGANGGVSNKRKGMALTPGWYNIVVPSQQLSTTATLQELIGRYRSTGDGNNQKAIATEIRKEANNLGLDRALALDLAKTTVENLLTELDHYLNELEHAAMPWGGKILGTAPQDDTMTAMVTGMLGDDLSSTLKDLGAVNSQTSHSLVEAVLAKGSTPQQALKNILGQNSDAATNTLGKAKQYETLLNSAPREVEALFDALNGQWLEPGPMGEPYRRPNTLPPGRTLYSFDQRALPTIDAESVGIKQAEALIETYRTENNGDYPDTFAFVLWSGEIAKNYGATEAQILHLLGTRVVRNWRGEVTGVALIPKEELGRPRVDVLVTTSGTYRDHFQDKVELITQAVKLAAASPEHDNPIAKATKETEDKLLAEGLSTDQALMLAFARVYSPAPGAYSPSIQFLAKSGDSRGDESKMADLYTRRLSHAYGGGLYGTYSQDTFEQQLTRMDAATLPRSSDVNGLLDHPMSAGFLGGLNLAKKALTGTETPLYISNMRNPDNPGIESAARALQTELHSRYFNPDWLAENQSHGYDGARNFMFLTDHLDLWDSTATDMVSSADWAEVKSVFVDDKYELGMDEFFDRHNPFAQQMLLTNLLGAAQRGHWNASTKELAQIAQRLVESATEHGPACEANQCRNSAMTEFIGKALDQLPDAAPLIEAYKSAIQTAVNPASGSAPSVGAAPMITGQVMEEVQTANHSQPTPSPTIWWYLISLAAVLFGIGWMRPLH